MSKWPTIPVKVQESPGVTGRNLGPLVLVNPLLERMQIREIVNRHCPKDPRVEVPIGEVIHDLVANRLCSPQPLLHVAEWADCSGAEFLLGTPPASLNDDRLARTLDAVFEHRWHILADVALHVSKEFDIPLSKLHYDPTSFHFTGEYDEQSDDPSLLPQIKPFKIEVGRHARPGDHVKEAQVGVDLANDGKGPVPIFYHSINGSANGHAAVAKNLQNLLTYLKPKQLLLTTDRGCFSEQYAVEIVRKHHFHFVSSLTWKDEFATLFHARKPTMSEASFLSIKERNKRALGKPSDTWERHLIGEIPYSFSYGNQSIRARLIFVHSSADQKICQKTRTKYTEQITSGLAQIQSSVQAGFSQDLQAVHKRVLNLYGNKGARRYFSYQVDPLTPEEIRQLPPRNKGQRKPTLKFSFQYHPELAEKDEKYDGIFVLATSLPKNTHSTDQIFTTFKEQHHIETAHHQWKAPIRLRPVFLKKVTRIESLVLVQFLALMAFYLLQRLYRQAQRHPSRTTAETLIRRFAICPVLIHDYASLFIVTTTKPVLKQTLTLAALGFPTLPQQILPFAAPQSPIAPQS